MKKAGIIGLGLIGGSIAKALKSKAGFEIVTALDSNTASLEMAKKDGVVDTYTINDCSVFSDSDIIFICAPTSAIPGYLEKLNGIVRNDCIVTDVSSVKSAVMEKAEALSGMQFIGGHPMAGSEKTGYEAANEFLFENAYYVITPSSYVTEEAVTAYKSLLSDMLCIPVVLDAKQHDRVTAAISHSPHLIASALVNMVRRLDDGNETMRALAAGGFRDITRIASSDSLLWKSIANENRHEILGVLDELQKELEEIRSYLKSGDETELGGYLRLAKTYRDNLPVSSRKSYMKTYELYVDVEDKPGSIAVVTTLLGVNGVNMKNIGIINSREYHIGALQIVFDSEDSMIKGAELLKKMRYDIYRNE